MSSRTSQVCMNMLSWPMMWKAMPAQSRCECSRSSSAVMTRIYSPLFGHLHAVYALHGHGVGEGVRVRADAADALHQHQRLDGVALRGQLLYAAVVVADEHLGVLYDLALGVELGVHRAPPSAGWYGPIGTI